MNQRVFVSLFLLGIVFVTSGLSKLRWFSHFKATVRSYRFIDSSLLINIGSVTLIVIEVGVGVWLVSGQYPRWSAVASIVLLAAFSAVVMIALAAGRTKIKCGCMLLSTSQEIGWYIPVRNLALTGVAFTTLVPKYWILLLIGSVALFLGSAALVDLNKVQA
jgi:uncharacterized membrane protein YphA (DoxX/SURF4 family)